jgi:hypothetical protein
MDIPYIIVLSEIYVHVQHILTNFLKKIKLLQSKGINFLWEGSRMKYHSFILTSYYRKRCSKRNVSLGKLSEHQMSSLQKLEMLDIS